jgi:hypothetical protein
LSRGVFDEGKVNKLSAVRAALLMELDDAAKLHFVNTRLILTIGVNLNSYDNNDNDLKKVEKTLKALHKMGYLIGKEVVRG